MWRGALGGALAPSCRLVATSSILDEEGVQPSQDQTLSHRYQGCIDIDIALHRTPGNERTPRAMVDLNWW